MQDIRAEWLTGRDLGMTFAMLWVRAGGIIGHASLANLPKIEDPPPPRLVDVGLLDPGLWEARSLRARLRGL